MRAFGDVFLAALSNGRPFGKCLTDDLADGPPSRLQVVQLPDQPSNAALVFEHDEPGTYVFQTHLVPTPFGGAWAAWERIPFEPPFERRIQLLWLGPDGVPVTGEVLEVGGGTVGSRFAIAAVGPGVAIATVEDNPSGATGSIDVRVLAEDGALLAETALTTDDAFTLDPSVDLLGSPAGDRLLVAWSESSAIANDDRRVRVTRLACVDP